MSETHSKILKLTQNHTPFKIPFIIYENMKRLLEKISSRDNDLTKSFTSKISKHTPSGYSLFTHCLFDINKNKHDF